MPKGKINVSVENIFPLIKKFLYSDQEIFLREIISNATDALTKIQHLSSIGEVKGEINELGVEIKIDKKNKIQSKKIFKTFSKSDGSPDGMTLDNKKNLWVAHFHGACVSVFNNKAKLIHRIQFEAKNITNCTFGGLNNNELFVTSTTKGMNSAEQRKYRYSGSLVSVKTNAKGLLQKKFILGDEKKRSLL